MARLWTLVAAPVLCCAVLAVALPWRVPRASLGEAVSVGLARGGRLRAIAAGPVFLKLLPRPRIQAADVAVRTDDGAFALDAPLLKAELDIPSLVRGAWRVTAATLVAPTVAVDLDRLSAPPPGDGPGPAGAVLHLRDAVVRASSPSAGDVLATGVDLSASWSDGGDDLVVAGTAAVRGIAGQFTATLRRPALALAPEGSRASLRLASPAIDAALEGTLSGGARPRFAGRVALTAPALARVLRSVGLAPVEGAPARVQLSGEVAAEPGGVALSDARLRLDGSLFEGALAWRRDGPRPVLAGTLATDLLDGDALFRGVLDRSALAALYRRPMPAAGPGFDVDLRVSAARARLGGVSLGDAAMAALGRGDRLELSLDGAQAYGGTVKARVLAVLGPGVVDAHAEVAAASIDLGALGRSLSGRTPVGGVLTARASVDGRGASLAGAVADLAGDGQIAVDGGRLAGLSAAEMLRGLGRRVPLEADRRATPTTFDRASWDVVVAGGVVRIPEGRLTAPGVTTTFSAETSLPDGAIAVHAVAAAADRGGLPRPGAAALPFDLRGSWDGPLVLLRAGGAVPPPASVTP